MNTNTPETSLYVPMQHEDAAIEIMSDEVSIRFHLDKGNPIFIVHKLVDGIEERCLAQLQGEEANLLFTMIARGGQ